MFCVILKRVLLMTNLTEITPRAIVPLVVVGCFALARKYVKPSARLSYEELSELDSRFTQTKWIVNLAMVAVSVVFGWSSYRLLVALNHYFAGGDDSGTSFWLWPDIHIWWFLPLFGALVLSWDITLKLWSVFGNAETVRLYRSWSDGRAGFDCTRFMRWMALVVVVPSGVGTILALPIHVAVRDHDIRACDYAWTSCKTFEAVRLTQIDGYRNRDGQLTHQAGFVLDFVDGRRWSSAHIGEFRNQVDSALGAFLVERTHLPLNRAQTDTDIPKEVSGT